jgi:hypothetical protein
LNSSSSRLDSWSSRILLGFGLLMPIGSAVMASFNLWWYGWPRTLGYFFDLGSFSITPISIYLYFVSTHRVSGRGHRIAMLFSVAAVYFFIILGPALFGLPVLQGSSWLMVMLNVYFLPPFFSLLAGLGFERIETGRVGIKKRTVIGMGVLLALFVVIFIPVIGNATIVLSGAGNIHTPASTATYLGFGVVRCYGHWSWYWFGSCSIIGD